MSQKAERLGSTTKTSQLQEEKIMGKRGVAVITNEDCQGKDEWWCYFYECQCGSHHLASWFKFCPECGIKLQWELDTAPLELRTPKPKTIEESIKDVEICFIPYGLKKEMP